MKIWTIAWKDTLVRFQDRNALLLMLVAPLVLSVIMGAALGSLVENEGSPIDRIPTIIINDDPGELGHTLVEAMSAEDITELIEPMIMDDLAEARRLVETGVIRAVIYIPPDFSRNLLSADDSTPHTEMQPVKLQVYTDPTKPISANIIRDIVNHIAIIFSSTTLCAQVTIEQIQDSATDPEAVAAEAGSALEEEIQAIFLEETGPTIALNTITSGRGNVNPLAYYVPSMAILFLTLVMFDNTRSILAEQQEGTLGRLRSTPTSLSQILLGKLSGSLLIGILQCVVLIVSTRVIFNLQWGNSTPALMLVVFAIVAAAASLGAIVAAFSQDTTQAVILGGSITLIFSVLGGSFFPARDLPSWLQVASRLTINYWGMEGFSDLVLRGLNFDSILLEAGILLSIACVLFLLAIWQFQRRFRR